MFKADKITTYRKNAQKMYFHWKPGTIQEKKKKILQKR